MNPRALLAPVELLSGVVSLSRDTPFFPRFGAADGGFFGFVIADG